VSVAVVSPECLEGERSELRRSGTLGSSIVGEMEGLEKVVSCGTALVRHPDIGLLKCGGSRTAIAAPHIAPLFGTLKIPAPLDQDCGCRPLLRYLPSVPTLRERPSERFVGHGLPCITVPRFPPL